MEPTIIAVVTVAALSIWYLRTRRHPGWRASDDGRSYILCGFSVFASSTYWLFHPPVGEWQSIFAGVWALGGIVAVVLGLGSLNRATARHAELAQAAETIPPAEHLANTSD